jgi:hypothetical protein
MGGSGAWFALEPVGRPHRRLRRVRTHVYATLLAATPSWRPALDPLEPPPEPAERDAVETAGNHPARRGCLANRWDSQALEPPPRHRRGGPDVDVIARAVPAKDTSPSAASVSLGSAGRPGRVRRGWRTAGLVHPIRVFLTTDGWIADPMGGGHSLAGRRGGIAQCGRPQGMLPTDAGSVLRPTAIYNRMLARPSDRLVPVRLASHRLPSPSAVTGRFTAGPAPWARSARERTSLRAQGRDERSDRLDQPPDVILQPVYRYVHARLSGRGARQLGEILAKPLVRLTGFLVKPKMPSL